MNLSLKNCMGIDDQQGETALAEKIILLCGEDGPQLAWSMTLNDIMIQVCSLRSNLIQNDVLFANYAPIRVKKEDKTGHTLGLYAGLKS